MLQPYNEEQANGAAAGYGDSGSRNDAQSSDDGNRANDDMDGPTDDDKAKARHRCIIFGLVIVALLAVAAILVPMLLDDCDCNDVNLRSLTFPPSQSKAPVAAPIVPNTVAPVVAPTPSPTLAPTPVPTLLPSETPTFEPTTARLFSFLNTIGYPVSGTEPFADKSSPQYRAAEFMITDIFIGQLTDVPPVEDRYTLVVLYNSLNGDGWTQCGQGDTACANDGRWLNPESDHCTWAFVLCENGRVAELNFGALTGNNLQGPIPDDIGQLEFLRTFIAADNGITGSFPPRFNALTNMREIVLSGNQIDGIPSDFLSGSVDTITRIFMENNQLAGPIPVIFGQFANVAELRLQGNSLTGVIPDELNQMSSLARINLADNNLRGDLTSGVYNPSLEWLDLSNNPEIRGTISGAAIANMPTLTKLRLGGTGITGNLPAELFDLPLDELNVDGADFSGVLPDGFANFRIIQFINLANNRFSGPFPTVFDTLATLNELQLQGNEFTGTVTDLLCGRRGTGVVEIQILSADCISEVTCTCCTQCF